MSLAENLRCRKLSLYPLVPEKAGIQVKPTHASRKSGKRLRINSDRTR